MQNTLPRFLSFISWNIALNRPINAHTTHHHQQFMRHNPPPPPSTRSIRRPQSAVSKQTVTTTIYKNTFATSNRLGDNFASTVNTPALARAQFYEKWRELAANDRFHSDTHATGHHLCVHVTCPLFHGFSVVVTRREKLNYPAAKYSCR